MNAEYPASPATPGGHPFPGVSQAVPQGPGGPESAPPAWGAVAPQSHTPNAPGGGHQRPAVPASPPPNPYANPTSAPARAATEHQPPASPAPGHRPPAPEAPPASTQHSTTQHSTTQHSTTQHSAPQQTTGAAPVRRASLRTGTQQVTPEEPNEETGRRRFGFFGKKSDVDDEPKSTEALRSKGGPRKVRAMLTSVDPWSIMKLSFLVAVAAGIAFVVATSVIWGILDQMGVFAAVQQQIKTLFGADDKSPILQYLEYNKIISGVTLVASFNVLIITALGTIGALIYNVVAKLVGGVYITLSDD